MQCDRQLAPGQRRPAQIIAGNAVDKALQIRAELANPRIGLGARRHHVAVGHPPVQPGMDAFGIARRHLLPHFLSDIGQLLPENGPIDKPGGPVKLPKEAQMHLGILPSVADPVAKHPDSPGVQLLHVALCTGPNAQDRLFHLAEVIQAPRFLVHRPAIHLHRQRVVTLGHELITGPDVAGCIAADLQDPQPTDETNDRKDREAQYEHEPGIDTGCHICPLLVSAKRPVLRTEIGTGTRPPPSPASSASARAEDHPKDLKPTRRTPIDRRSPTRAW